MSPEERAADFRNHLTVDFKRQLIQVDLTSDPDLLVRLVDDAMFYIEHLVLEKAEDRTVELARRLVERAEELGA